MSIIMGYWSLNKVLSNHLLIYHVLQLLHLTRLILSTQKWLLASLKGLFNPPKNTLIICYDKKEGLG